MAGDASLGITPVMKWNFERSCYRWLVTRHPAQFERLDFTAQILQSASRARKAFYECGWAEAKVLIRPSDGKFERTPFFDAIIRRGLRNSTRFDAATLTEDEIEALGMHRDETLGFKLQIRHFRSSRKELPPQGRGGGAVRKAPLAPLPPPPPQAHRHGGGPAAAVARHLLPPSIAPPPTAGAGNGRDRTALLEQQQQQQQQRLSWGAAEAVAAAAVAGHPSGDLRWADEARWHHAAAAAGPGAGAVMDGSNNYNGGGRGERWAAWDGGNRWMPGEEGAGANADDGHLLRHAGHATPPLLPGLVQAPSPAATGVTASRRSAGVWEGAPHGGGWVGGPADMRLQGSSWHLSGGASGAAEGRGQGYERMAHSGMGEGAGVARDAFAGDRRHQHQQPEVDVRGDGGGGGGGGDLRFHPSAVEHQQHHGGPSTRTAAPRVVGGSAVPAPSFRHGAVGVDPAPAVAGGTSADPSSVAAGGSLLSQGYRRLAAMADEEATTAAGGQLDLTGGRRGGGAHPPPPPPAAVLNRPPVHHCPIGRPPLPHEYDAAVAERDTDHHKRSASSLVGAGSSGKDPAGCSPLGERPPPRHGQVSGEPPFSSLAGGDGPAAKRRRPSVDGGDRPFGGVMQQQQQQQQQVRGRSTSNERLKQGNGNAASWSRGASGSGTPPPPATAPVHDDVLARELEESERELLSSRVAVDLAQARYEEASRTHHAKREQVLAAAAAEHQKQLSVAASHHHQGQEQQQQQTAALQGGASLHSRARSSEVAAETSAPNARATAGAGAGTGDGRHGAAKDGRGSGSEERRNGDADAVFHHRDSPPLGRRSPAAPGRSERPSEAYGRSPTLEALGAGSASSVGKVSSSPSPSAAGQAQPDCADEMMEVKLEAALLCGMGRAPVSSRQLASAAAGAAVTPSPKAVTAGAEKGLEIVSLAAAAASAVASSSGDGDGNGGVPPRSSSSSPGGIRRGLSERTHSPLPSLPWKGGHHNHHHHHHHHHHHRSAMGQAPGSPSACGETDSDHSSDRGCAAVEDLAGSKKQQHHELQRPVVPRAVGRGGAGRLSWADYGDGSGDRRAPSLAKLTADVLV